MTQTGTAVGTVLLVPLRGGTAGEVEVGWHLHPDHWGNGYATEAASGAIARGLAAGLPEVLAVVRPDNAASQAVCRRLGMQARGLSERYYGTALEVFSSAPNGAVAGPDADSPLGDGVVSSRRDGPPARNTAGQVRRVGSSTAR